MRALMIAAGLALLMGALALGQATYGYHNNEPLPLDRVVSDDLMAPEPEEKNQVPETIIWEF